jgi:hypothetical protein
VAVTPGQAPLERRVLLRDLRVRAQVIADVAERAQALDRDATSSADRTTTSTSTTGFDGRPGTDVLPTCSTSTPRSATASRTGEAISSNSAGHRSS